MKQKKICHSIIISFDGKIEFSKLYAITIYFIIIYT